MSLRVIVEFKDTRTNLLRVLTRILSVLIANLSALNRLMRSNMKKQRSGLASALPRVDFPLSQSILVTTFEKRFQNALPLVQELRKQMPSIPILVFINGNLNGDHDKTLRSNFTKSLSAIPDIDIICNNQMTGISRNWNLGIQLAATDQVLCLSDDILIESDFFKDVEILFNLNVQEGLTIVESFACFIIHKNMIDEIGWFDERYLGFGAEDGDYLWRFEEHFGFPPLRHKIDSLKHEWSSERGGDVARGAKYSLVNYVYNDLKYPMSDRGMKGPFAESRISLMANRSIHPMEDFRRKTTGVLLESNPVAASEVLSKALETLQVDRRVK